MHKCFYPLLLSTVLFFNDAAQATQERLPDGVLARISTITGLTFAQGLSPQEQIETARDALTARIEQSLRSPFLSLVGSDAPEEREEAIRTMRAITANVSGLPYCVLPQSSDSLFRHLTIPHAFNMSKFQAVEEGAEFVQSGSPILSIEEMFGLAPEIFLPEEAIPESVMQRFTKRLLRQYARSYIANSLATSNNEKNRPLARKIGFILRLRPIEDDRSFRELCDFLILNDGLLTPNQIYHHGSKESYRERALNTISLVNLLLQEKLAKRNVSPAELAFTLQYSKSLAHVVKNGRPTTYDAFLRSLGWLAAEIDECFINASAEGNLRILHDLDAIRLSWAQAVFTLNHQNIHLYEHAYEVLGGINQRRHVKSQTIPLFLSLFITKRGVDPRGGTPPLLQAKEFFQQYLDQKKEKPKDADETISPRRHNKKPGTRQKRECLYHSGAEDSIQRLAAELFTEIGCIQEEGDRMDEMERESSDTTLATMSSNSIAPPPVVPPAAIDDMVIQHPADVPPATAISEPPPLSLSVPVFSGGNQPQLHLDLQEETEESQSPSLSRGLSSKDEVEGDEMEGDEMDEGSSSEDDMSEEELGDAVDSLSSSSSASKGSDTAKYSPTRCSSELHRQIEKWIEENYLRVKKQKKQPIESALKALKSLGFNTITYSHIRYRIKAFRSRHNMGQHLRKETRKYIKENYAEEKKKNPQGYIKSLVNELKRFFPEDTALSSSKVESYVRRCQSKKPTS